MSDSWSPPLDEPPRVDAEPARLAFADLALPLVLGGVLPTVVLWCSTCIGLSVVAVPFCLIGTFGGGALAGANVRRRRGGSLGARQALAVGGALTAIQVLPCTPSVGFGFVLPEEEGAWMIGPAILLSLAIWSGLLIGVGAAGVHVGDWQAGLGAFGPAWTGARPPAVGDSAQTRAAGYALVGIVGSAVLGVAALFGLVFALLP